MIAAPELSVTLSPALMKHLRAESRKLGIAIEWLVAGIVADTVSEPQADRPQFAASA